MPDQHYTDPRLAALYDLESGWSADRDFYLALAGADPVSILDLGCGTGLLAAAYAAIGHQVTAVDPAEAMLALARQRPHADRVQWILDSAQSFRPRGATFDLIVMTGNAFQVLLNKTDVLAVFRTIEHGLAGEARAVFETRNPRLDWTARWNGEKQLRLDNQPILMRRQVLWRKARLISFEQIFELPDAVLSSSSTLRFWQVAEIEALAQTAGLRMVSVFGDWAGAAFDPATSEEMVIELRRA